VLIFSVIANIAVIFIAQVWLLFLIQLTTLSDNDIELHDVWDTSLFRGIRGGKLHICDMLKFYYSEIGPFIVATEIMVGYQV